MKCLYSLLNELIGYLNVHTYVRIFVGMLKSVKASLEDELHPTVPLAKVQWKVDFSVETCTLFLFSPIFLLFHSQIIFDFPLYFECLAGESCMGNEDEKAD